jgi:AhpD family alkylhydroperoxidase
VNEQLSALVALGASAAANCRPCLDHHLARARAAENTDTDIADAIRIGLGVSEGARRKTIEYVDQLLTREPVGAAGGCC